MVLLSLAAAALTACGGPPPDCVTRNGLWVYGSDECEFMSAFEDALIPRLAPGERWDLEGWHVNVHPAPFYSERHGYGVNGYTTCGTWTMEINALTWRDSTFLHEVTHALDGCRTDRGDPDPDHPRWKERGLWQQQIDAKAEIELRYGPIPPPGA